MIEVLSPEEFVITNIIIQYTKDFKYDCNGFKYQSNGYPFLEGTRASLFTTQSIWLEIKRDVPNLEPYQNVSFPISKAKILGFVDENGNKLYMNLANYGVEGERESVWFVDNVKKYHRTFSTIVNSLIEAGFTIEKMIEPLPTEELVEKYPECADFLQ